MRDFLVGARRQMNRTIQTLREVTARILSVVRGFKSMCGYWPSTIDVDPEGIASLATISLTTLSL
jgi:hypothetical protein